MARECRAPKRDRPPGPISSTSSFKTRDVAFVCMATLEQTEFVGLTTLENKIRPRRFRDSHSSGSSDCPSSVHEVYLTTSLGK
eukprot:237299-Heterocapsa_arctica.AAC.1